MYVYLFECTNRYTSSKHTHEPLQLKFNNLTNHETSNTCNKSMISIVVVCFVFLSCLMSAVKV